MQLVLRQEGASMQSSRDCTVTHIVYGEVMELMVDMYLFKQICNVVRLLSEISLHHVHLLMLTVLSC